jgi:hypothetical protein
MIAVAHASTRAMLKDAGFALLAALAYVALQATVGFPSLSSAADNDSMLRLVEIRDLIGGQAWFDLHQYRMGLSGGFVMHWSRLVDAPIAAIILAANALGASMATAETIALVVWPTLLFGVALYFLLRAARLFFGGEVLLPALLIGASSLHYIGIFAPGSLDHHNVQLVMVLGMLCALAEASRSNSAIAGAAAGAFAALLLGVAMEAAPYVAVAGLAVALWFLLAPTETWRAVFGFGLAFGAVAAGIFVATIPPAAWRLSACDAYSLPQFAAATLSGFGIAVLSSSSMLRRSVPGRAVALAGLGLCLASIVVLIFPQCLGDPYAGLDPRLKSWWLDAVTEAQPAWKIVLVSPGMAAGRYAPPLIALLYLATARWHGTSRREPMLLAGLLGAAVLVSLWQVRGSVFSIPLAVIPLAGFVTARRRQANATGSAAAIVGMVFAWLISFNIVWTVAADGLAAMQLGRFKGVAEAADTAGDCLKASDFEQLAELPASVLVTISNLGAPVLRYTQHRVLAGPYHRNVQGNLAALDVFAGPAADAPGIVHRHGVAFVALCRGNSESRALATRAPDGLLASLLSGNVPDWLEVAPASTGRALEIYRVLPPK